jgi:Asp-tRNA(Asn)/Glu-tRNA(Gln) amidotransferase A subunit family amidase
VAPATLAISLADAALFPDEVWDRRSLLPREIDLLLDAAAQLPAAAVVRAQQVRRLVCQRLREIFDAHQLDALVVPGMVEAPPRREADGTSHSSPRASAVNYLANLTGQPAITLPVPLGGTPGAVQLIGRPFADSRLLDIAAGLEWRCEPAMPPAWLELV